MRTDYADEKVQFGMWLGTPPQYREPKTQKEFAKTIDIANETLSRWKRDPKVVEIARNFNVYNLKRNLTEVFKITAERAITGNSADRRLYFELTGELDKSKKDKPEPLGKIIVEHIIDK